MTGDTGAEGERGPSGDPGSHGERGPKGDHGQHGDTGAQGEQGRAGTNARGKTVGAMVGVVVMLLLMSTVFYTGLRNQARELEQSSLSNCIRTNINSARIALGPPPQRFPTLFPIIDCRQSLLRGRAIILTDDERTKYISVVARSRAPIVKDGMVVGSRGSVLDQVQSLDTTSK